MLRQAMLQIRSITDIKFVDFLGKKYVNVKGHSKEMGTDEIYFIALGSFVSTTAAIPLRSAMLTDRRELQ